MLMNAVGAAAFILRSYVLCFYWQNSNAVQFTVYLKILHDSVKTNKKLNHISVEVDFKATAVVDTEHISESIFTTKI